MQRPLSTSMDSDDGLRTFDSPGCENMIKTTAGIL